MLHICAMCVWVCVGVCVCVFNCVYEKCAHWQISWDNTSNADMVLYCMFLQNVLHFTLVLVILLANVLAGTHQNGKDEHLALYGVF